jgi:hypothetical protein
MPSGAEVCTGTDVMIFKNIFAEKCQKSAFFVQNNASLRKIWNITLFLKKFRRKFSKIAENVTITSTAGVPVHKYDGDRT